MDLLVIIVAHLVHFVEIIIISFIFVLARLRIVQSCLNIEYRKQIINMFFKRSAVVDCNLCVKIERMSVADCFINRRIPTVCKVHDIKQYSPVISV